MITEPKKIEYLGSGNEAVHYAGRTIDLTEKGQIIETDSEDLADYLLNDKVKFKAVGTKNPPVEAKKAKKGDK